MMSTCSTTSSDKNEASVAVIGGGPGGMFFIHHVLHHLKEYCILNNIKITCYERTSQPGGIWRSPIRNGTTGSTASNKELHNTEADMYDQLWTNGPCHGIEFYDYTYQEHFQNEPITVYLKRQQLLEYIVGRVTKNYPNFFEEFFQFNTEVIHVKYNQTLQKFVIETKNVITGDTSTNYFDKCIWAAGLCGKLNIPTNVYQLFQVGQFRGKIIHSAQVDDLEDYVRNKRILLIGGAYSAEDIALQSIKFGVEKVYICSRLKDAEISSTSVWPYNKVEVLLGKEVKAVVNGGKCIQLRDLEWTYNGYCPVNDNDASYDLYDIDTVIFCTGYKPCLQMLDNELNQGLPAAESYYNSKYVLEPPPEPWVMNTNLLTAYTGGHVEFCPKLRYLTDIVHPSFYHGVLISNPNMMFISDYANMYPILSIDAHAWFFAQIVTGVATLPSVDEMKQYNINKSYELLHYPYHRLSMDENYCNVICSLPNFWPKDSNEYPEPYYQSVLEGYKHTFHCIAHFMHDCSYPLLLWDEKNKILNDNGEALCQYEMHSYEHRLYVGSEIEHCNDEEAWKTFGKTYRDYDNANEFRSIFTGQLCVPLPKKWLEIIE